MTFYPSGVIPLSFSFVCTLVAFNPSLGTTGIPREKYGRISLEDFGCEVPTYAWEATY